MTKQFATDVLICGAGAAGLTLAIDLARRGVAFRLIEKTDGPFSGSRGKAVQPRSQEVFEDLGILDRVAALGGLYPPQREYRDDGSDQESEIMEDRGRSFVEPYHIPLMVPQFATGGVMRERLAELGHRPRFGCELHGFEQDDTGVTVRIADQAGEETLRVRYLAGTDGGQSLVRRVLGVDFPGQALGIRAVVADVTLTGLDRDAWHRFKGGPTGLPMSLCPLAGYRPFPVAGSCSAGGRARSVRRRTIRHGGRAHGAR